MLRLTPTAASALKMLMVQEAVPDHGLRIQLVGGGCEGLYYDLELAPEPLASDETFMSEGLRLFVDRRALALLDGTTLDYQGGFRFENPNARRVCRCGGSFR